VIRDLSASGRAALAAAASILAAACGSRAAPAPLAHQGASRGVTLIAARESGLYEITVDGRDVRQLSATPAQQPRWQVPGRRLLFLTHDAAELRSLDLGTAKEQVVARLRNRLDCPGGRSPAGPVPWIELEVHDDDDFVVQPERACLRLMDRNANMADYILDLRVDLATGRTAEYVVTTRDDCKLPRREAPFCGLHAEPVLPDAPELEHAGPADFLAMSASPSGRWVVLRGPLVMGDYLYNPYVLYEPATRRTFPIAGELVAESGAWPAPLTSEQLALDASELGSLVGLIIVETPIYWLAGPADRLVVGEHLVVPGVRIAQVGQLARVKR
jgi:hypothetical protein